MNDQHVLGLEWLLLTRTILPLADEALLIRAHMVIIQVLKNKNENFQEKSGTFRKKTHLNQLVLSVKVSITIDPMTMCFEKLLLLLLVIQQILVIDIGGTGGSLLDQDRLMLGHCLSCSFSFHFLLVTAAMVHG